MLSVDFRDSTFLSVSVSALDLKENGKKQIVFNVEYIKPGISVIFKWF